MFEGMYLVMFIFGLVLAIAWIVLPFALIGTKPLLRELIAETRKTNALLGSMTIRAAPVVYTQRTSTDPE